MARLNKYKSLAVLVSSHRIVEYSVNQRFVCYASRKYIEYD